MSEIVKRRSQAASERAVILPSRRITHALQPLRSSPPPSSSGGETATPPQTSGPPPPAAPVMVELADLERVREAEYRRGYDDARQELIARVEKDLQALRDLLGSVGGQLEAFRQRMEEDGFRLAIAVAERIVRREVALDDAAVIGQVKEAIGRLVGVEAITLRVNPADEELVRSQRQELQARADGVQEMVIEGDEKVERGGCIIESIAGNVDARRATVIAQIEAALFGQPGGGI